MLACFFLYSPSMSAGLLYAVSFVMRPQEYKFNGLVSGCGTIGAGNKFSISLFLARGTIQVDNHEVPFERTGVKSTQIPSQRFAKLKGVFYDLTDLQFDLFFDVGMLFDSFQKCLFKSRLHHSPKTSSKVCHSAVPLRSRDCASMRA